MTQLGAPPAVVEETIDRRGFLTRTMLGALSIFGVAFGGASIAVLWPERKPGFGNKIVVGKRNDILAELERTGRPIWNPEGKFYLVRYEGGNRDYVVRGVQADGLMALYQRCPHLGCRVPYCPTSGWFECPCHSARFNPIGEVMDGPAPAGMWHFPIRIDADGFVVVDTSQDGFQPPRGLDSIRREAAGPHCA